MQMDPRSILAGRDNDPMGALGRGLLVGQRQNQIGTENRLTGLYQAQGPQIMAGEQGALNALAGIDPMAAMGVQTARLGQDATRQDMAISRERLSMARQEAAMGVQTARLGQDATRQDMAISRERLSMARQEAAMRAQEYARSISAEQAAAQAAEIEQALSGAAPLFQTGDREGYAAWLAREGLDPADYPFEQFPAFAASMAGVRDALKSVTTQAENPSDRFKVVGSQLVDLAAEGGPAMVMEAPGQTETIYGPDGKPIIERGPSNAKQKPTEGNLTSAGYLQRMTGAEKIMDDLAAKGVTAIGLTDTVAVGTRFEPYKLSSDEQLLVQAQRDWVRAKLRKESGAVISPEEEANEIRTYFPQPGQDKAQIDQKREARKRAERQLQIGSASASDQAGPLTDSGADGLLPDDLQWLEGN
jgi:hypothetical protein